MIAEPVAPVAPPVVGYATPVPVAPEAEFDYGPPAGPAVEVGGYYGFHIMYCARKLIAGALLIGVMLVLAAVPSRAGCNS